MVGYKWVLYRPTVTPTSGSAVNTANACHGYPATGSLDNQYEASNQTTLTNITHFIIDATQGWKRKPMVELRKKRYVSQGMLAIHLRDIAYTIVFNRVWIGNLDGDSQARNRLAWLEYAAVEWPKLAAVSGKVKVSPLVYQDFSTAPADDFTEMAAVKLYKGGVVRPTVLIADYPLSADNWSNTYIDQLVLDVVWS